MNVHPLLLQVCDVITVGLVLLLPIAFIVLSIMEYIQGGGTRHRRK